ncbi:DUF3048 domain-containing protein [Nocardioides nematodiphilus]|uniref:DUF3048 domain-containing protein n=1 Tax=Nocardioides nematodiphilus TaxID=2849669 RepID=UPI001CD960AB|nr:DUF3048 domain-containing protein [Nocardioides nematodiphilus]MCA1984181.1 DUF3048 domain-containing protein [Nocardioides nematodiphilus]
MRPTRTLVRAIVPLALASVVLTGCGGGSKDSSSGDSTPTGGSSAPAAPAVPSTWPLTGLSAPDGAAETKHSVYIAKIDNTYASKPQYGIGQADLVTQELVEGGITRLAVFFYSKLPEKAGPIRSMRLTDIGVAKPLGAKLVTSGAAPVTLQGLAKAGVKFIDMNNDNVKRVLDGSHDTLHSVQANLTGLAKSSQQKTATRPQDFFEWGKDADFKGKGPATTVNTRISNQSGSDDIWKYTAGKYVLANSYMDPASTYNPDTVIALTVKTSLAPYRDPAGNPVPVTHFEGKGKGWIFHGGTFLPVTWTKDGVEGLPTFTAKDGSPVKVPAGHVWLALVPQGGDAVQAGSVTWSK